MKIYTITQKLLGLGATYSAVAEGASVPEYMVKGKLLTFTPKLEMRRGEADAVINTLRGNIWGTRFTVLNQNGAELAQIRYKLLSFTAKFALTIGDKTYQAKGGIMARKFSCQDESGRVVLSISKELNLRDKFQVSVDEEALPVEVGVLAAVSIDQKYFQGKN
jgi:uncharacterized protein YxjI